MGENLEIPGRLAVRTPMQWTDQPQGGFTRADARKVQRRVPEGPYGPTHVNVARQRKDPDSLFTFLKLLVHTYRQSPELGWSEMHALEQPCAAVLAHECRAGGRRLVALHNLSPDPCEVPLQLEDATGQHLTDLLQEGTLEVDDRGRVTVDLPRYGYRWLRLAPPGTRLLS